LDHLPPEQSTGIGFRREIVLYGAEVEHAFIRLDRLDVFTHARAPTSV
jgi:hypothetical protein